MKIVPAILAENLEDFILRLRQAEKFTDYVQIDLMDGIFVPTKSFPPAEIKNVSTSLSFEVHLMVKEPSAYMSLIGNKGLKKVIFHFESDVQQLDLINRIKETGLSAGIAIKPETEIDEFRNTAEYADALLFLAVDPCCYGNPFRPEVLNKVASARRLFPDKIIGVDGGVSLDNLMSFVELGVDYVCVGSRVFLKGTPEKNYRLFTDMLKKYNDETSKRT